MATINSLDTGDIIDAEDAQKLPTNAEDRRAAEAMSTLEGRGDDDETKQARGEDAEALGQAMKNLASVDKVQMLAAGEEKKVKVDAADVTLLVSRSRD